MNGLSKRNGDGSNLVVPLKPVTIKEIESAVGKWLEQMMGKYSPIDLYVYMRQFLAIAEIGMEKLEPKVLEKLHTLIPSGEGDLEILGHQVHVRSLGKWAYSQNVNKLKLEQKSTIQKRRKEERNAGVASRIVRNEPRISVRLRKQ